MKIKSRVTRANQGDSFLRPLLSNGHNNGRRCGNGLCVNQSDLAACYLLDGCGSASMRLAESFSIDHRSSSSVRITPPSPLADEVSGQTMAAAAAGAAGAGAANNPLVEWRVFFPLDHPVMTTHGAALVPPPPLLGDLFQDWAVEAEDGVEDRVDTYALVGVSDGVGLKHRGQKKKKPKLEVKVRTRAWPACECLGVVGGVEAWKKYKLGKAEAGDGGGGGKGGGGLSVEVCWLVLTGPEAFVTVRQSSYACRSTTAEPGGGAGRRAHGAWVAGHEGATRCVSRGIPLVYADAIR